MLGVVKFLGTNTQAAKSNKSKAKKQHSNSIDMAQSERTKNVSKESQLFKTMHFCE